MKNKFDLPDYCFAEEIIRPGEIIILKYGMKGYYPTQYKGNPMEYNKKIGVTWEQMKAMVSGSMFGWDVPACNPEMYKGMKEKIK